MALAQAPFGFTPLVFIAGAFFLYLLESFVDTRRNLYRLSFCSGWAMYCAAMCYWMGYFGLYALLAFLIFEFLISYCFVSVVARISPSHHRIVYFALMWVAFEWMMGHFPILSFTWLNLSTTVLNISDIRIFARVGGGALLTFIVIFVSGLLLRGTITLYSNRHSLSSLRAGRSAIIQLASIVIVTIILLSLAQVELHTHRTRMTISVLQGNNKNRPLTLQEKEHHFLSSSHLSLAQTIKGKKDIIVFPESSLSTDPENDELLKSSLGDVALKTNKLLIANSRTYSKGHNYNRNNFYSPHMDLLGFNDKVRLVPFGEYVPFDSLFGSLSIFNDIRVHYSPGTNGNTIRGVTSLVCFESAFTDDVRNVLTHDTKLLVVTTNNRSYRRSGNSAQHLAQTQLRAAEYGISIVHASVSGSSAFIERDGTITKHTPLFERTVLDGQLSAGKPDSIYAWTGDWLSLGALFVVLSSCLLRLRKSSWRNRTSTK